MMGKKGYNRLIYHSIYLLQTVIFVVKKFLSGFDGHSISPYKGKEEAQQNKINGTKVTFQCVQERAWRRQVWLEKKWELHLNNRFYVILTFFKLLKWPEMALNCQFSTYLAKSNFAPFLTYCSLALPEIQIHQNSSLTGVKENRGRTLVNPTSAFWSRHQKQHRRERGR